MSEIVLETNALTKYYGGKLALDHLSIKIPRGCICGFVGRNGSGKTTAIKLMLGLLEPSSGSSALLGCDSRSLTPEIRERIGYVAEGHHLFGWMTIAELENFQSAFFPGRWDESFFADMIEYFQLSKFQKIKEFSHGQRAQVSLAIALAPNPELLIMDDPTLGLDAAIRQQFLAGIIELILHQGRTVFFSSHILADVERVAERIVVIDKAVLRANCTVEQFRKSVKKLKVRFTGRAPSDVNINGLLQCRRSDNELELTLVGIEEEEIIKWTQSAKAEQYQIVGLSLEEQFIEFTEPAERRRLFKWEKL